MKTALITAILPVILLASGCGREPEQQRNPLEELTAAERAFADQAVSQGIRAAFLANLAESSLVFLPEPTDGRSHYEGDEDTGSLTWEPRFVSCSADGTLGFTTGPWTFQGGGEGDPEPVHGHYITVWARKPGRPWKVILDIGITYPDPFPRGGPVEQDPPGDRMEGTDIAQAKEDLVALDRALSGAADRTGSLLAASAPSAWFFRNGERPARGREAALDLLQLTLTDAPEPSDRERWAPLGAGVAGSGDLGYTYGYAGCTDDSTSYLRIRRRKPGQGWKIVLDVVI